VDVHELVEVGRQTGSGVCQYRRKEERGSGTDLTKDWKMN